MKKEVYFAFVFMLIALLTLSLLAAQDIRPANQREDKGTDVQIRPANQLDLPSNGNGGYVPTQGSSYSSGYTAQLNSEMNSTAKINSTNLTNMTSNATGTAKFVVDKASNTLSYDVEYKDLSSNETGTTINMQGLNQNAIELLFLPIGMHKVGVVKYVDAIEEYLLNGQTYINIKSLLFPNGELRGQITPA